MLKGKTIKKIKTMRFERRHNSTKKQLDTWSIFNCLIFETPHEQDRYILNEGRWYKISKDFAEEVDGCGRDLFEEGKKLKKLFYPMQEKMKRKLSIVKELPGKKNISSWMHVM